MQRDEQRLLHEHYNLSQEQGRLDQPLGIVEFERTKEILLRHLPPAPATIADIGGGPGRYALWLASLGYRVSVRAVVPLHVEQLQESASRIGAEIDARVGDGLDLDLDDEHADAVLLLGPLYHLTERENRLRALREAGRVARRGAPIFAAVISRWSPRLHAEVVRQYYRVIPGLHPTTLEVERTGALPPLGPGSFTGYCHRPDELRDEISDADLTLLYLVGVEGISFALSDLEARLNDEADREVVFQAARELESVPELLGLSPHLLAVATKS